MAKLQLVKVEELNVCGSLILSNPVTFNVAMLFLLCYISQLFEVDHGNPELVLRFERQQLMNSGRWQGDFLTV